MAFKLTNTPYPKKRKGEPEDKSETTNEIRSLSQQTAEKKLEDYLYEQGYRGRSDPRSPQYKLYQDTKTQEYIFRPE